LLLKFALEYAIGKLQEHKARRLKFRHGSECREGKAYVSVSSAECRKVITNTANRPFEIVKKFIHLGTTIISYPHNRPWRPIGL
jgi:hypothetical protein